MAMRRGRISNHHKRGPIVVGPMATFGLAYISFMMVMLVFFIYLSAHSSVNTIRRSQVLESLSKRFVSVLKEKDSPLTIVNEAKNADFEVHQQKDRFIITMPGARVFDSGDDHIREEVLPVLSRIASLVSQFKLSVTIEGHTDDRPIYTPRFPSNWALSTARAVSVLRLFLEQGVPADKLSASGRGEFHPIESNETEEGRARNRRVILIVSAEELATEGNQP